MEAMSDTVSARSSTSLLMDLVSRVTEPAKQKMRLVHLLSVVCVGQLVAFIVNKYELMRDKLDESSTNNNSNNNNNNSKSHTTKPSRLDARTSIKLSGKEFHSRCLQLFEQIESRIKELSARVQTMSADCRTSAETSPLFCEPHIQKGFRPANRPYSYYVKSLFSKHNETVNAWSHYLGAVYLVVLAFKLDFSSPYSWPILTSMLTSMVMLITSASAHLMHSKSHACHMTCFLCDFGGISFSSFGAALMQTYMCSPIWYYKTLEPFLLPLCGIQSAMCCLLNSLAQTLYRRPYPAMKKILQILPCGSFWLFTMLPIGLQCWAQLTAASQPAIAGSDVNATANANAAPTHLTMMMSMNINLAAHALHILIFLAVS